MREKRKCLGYGDSFGDQCSGGRAKGENWAVGRKGGQSLGRQS